MTPDGDVWVVFSCDDYEGGGPLHDLVGRYRTAAAARAGAEEEVARRVGGFDNYWIVNFNSPNIISQYGRMKTRPTKHIEWEQMEGWT